MLSETDHDRLVAKLYASAMGDVPWTSTLEDAATLFGTRAALFQVNGPDKANIAYEKYGYSDSFAAAFFQSEVYTRDPRPPYFASAPLGTLYYDHMLYDVEEVLRNPDVRASCDVLGVTYQLGAVSSLPNGARATLTLLSSDREGHASEEAIRALGRLAPHIQQASSLGHIIEQGAATKLALLDALSVKADGIVMLDRDGRPSFVNDAARVMLAAGDGLAWSNGVFVTRRGPETRRLQKMVAESLTAERAGEATRGGHMLVSRNGGLRPYVVRVMAAPPLDRFLTGHSIACVMHLHDLAGVRLPSRVLLCEGFGLTEREADLAVELVRCAGLVDAATNARMAANTARNHLQSIFRKCGATNQIELVQLFGRLL